MHLLVIFMLSTTAHAREAGEQFLSSSLFMVANLFPNPPRFFQLNYGRRLTDNDTLLIEAITWTYDAPLGIPWGPDFEDPQHDFPGYVRDIGVGVAYQRFWWRGLFSTVHATPFYQTYHDPDRDRIQAGFQLFVVGRLGYHFSLRGGRAFIEPSVACTSWPINTNLPDGFAALEDRWPSYFLAEPGLNIGFRL